MPKEAQQLKDVVVGLGTALKAVERSLELLWRLVSLSSTRELFINMYDATIGVYSWDVAELIMTDYNPANEGRYLSDNSSIIYKILKF